MIRLATIPTTLVLLASAAPASVGAQLAPASGALGQRVRVVTPTRDRLIGELRAVVVDTLVLAVPGVRGGRNLELMVPPSQVRGLYVSSRRSTRGSRALRGAAIGAVAGGVTGFWLGAQCGECEGAGASALGIAILAPVGAGLGAVLAATTGTGERWEKLAWPPRAASPR